jgi:hypothetical protein
MAIKLGFVAASCSSHASFRKRLRFLQKKPRDRLDETLQYFLIYYVRSLVGVYCCKLVYFCPVGCIIYLQTREHTLIL